MKKSFLAMLVAFSMLSVCLNGVFISPVEASTTTHAFDSSTGKLSVDYANYISKHDIVYKSPINNSQDGVPIGNGRVGAVVWNSNGLNLQVTNTDGSPQTTFSSGLLKLYTNPGMDSTYTQFDQRLNLYDGTVTTTYDSNRTITVFGDPDSELLGIHVEDARTGLNSVTLDLSIWDTSGLANGGYMIDIPNINDWKVVNTFADSSGVAISRGQNDPDHFGYTLMASVDGASYTTQTVDSRTLRINITPSTSYTIWIANPSRQNSPNHDSVSQARSLITSAKTTGYTSILNNFRSYWHDFWTKSFVQYSNSTKDADYIENLYYASLYYIAGGSRAKFPFQFMGGPYRWNGDTIKWKWGYWHFNTRSVVDSLIVSNHSDLMTSYFNLYSNNLAKIVSDTKTYFNVDGAKVPEVMKWNGTGVHDSNVEPYTSKIFSSGSEVAHNMYMKYKSTNDTAFLSNTAYPFMKQVVEFYRNYVTYDGTHYNVNNANSQENYWNVNNPAPDLAAIREIFPMAIEASQILNVDASLRTEWQNILQNIAPLKTSAYGSGYKYLPHDLPMQSSHNSQNPELEIVYPHGVTGIGATDLPTAVNTFNARAYSNPNANDIWAQDGIHAARLGLGDASFNLAKTMLTRNQTHANGICDDGNGMFEPNGINMTTINEQLLQSYNDIIRVFPAVPSDSSFTGKFTLLAKGGFLVSSEKESGEIKYIGVKSLYGNSATVANPWGTQAVQVRRASDNAIVHTSSSSQISFSTTSDSVYVIERILKPLTSYTFEQLTGSKNDAPKYLSTRVLGSPGVDLNATWVDDRSTSVTYSGTWGQGGDADEYQGTESYSNTVNGYAEFTFSGTSIKWIGSKQGNVGKADVYIDGTLAASGIDTYSAARSAQQELYTNSNLTNGTHTIKVVVTGQKNAASSGAYLVIDAFVYSQPATQTLWVDDRSTSVTYSGTWGQGGAADEYQGTESYSNTVNGYAQFTFTGTSIKWIGSKQGNVGKADVYIDGILAASGIDTYSAARSAQQELYTNSNLTNGTHTIKVVVTGQKNAASSGAYLVIDAFVYSQPAS